MSQQQTPPAMGYTMPVLTPALAAAIVDAQAQVEAARKDRHAPGEDGYDYASAEEIISTAKPALAASGLGLLPLTYSLEPTAPTTERGMGGLDVVRQLRLIHRSGAYVEWAVRWPVHLSGGRGRDKAVAGALTSLLGYVLRDLLQIPRGIAGEQGMDERRDEPSSSAAPPARTGETVVCGDRPSWMRREKEPARAPLPADAPMSEVLGLAPGDGLPPSQITAQGGDVETPPDGPAGGAVPPAALTETTGSPGDLLDEREQVRHLLEDRLRVELERTRDQIQTRESATDGAASPAPGALPGAAPKVDADRLSSETSTAGPDAVSEPAPPPADEATDEDLGAEVARQFLARENDDDSTDAGPSPAGGSTVEESSPAPEPVSPGQGASHEPSTPADAGADVQGSGGESTAAAPRPEVPGQGASTGEAREWAFDYASKAWRVAPEEPPSDRPSGEPDGAVCPDCDHALLFHDASGCQTYYGDGSGGSLLCECERAGPGEAGGPPSRCAECDAPLAADSTVCPDPECASNERQGTAAEALEALVGDDEVRCVSCEEPISGEPADEEDGGPLCSKCAGPVRAPSEEQVNVVSNVAAALAPIGPADLRGQKRAKALERAAQREWSRVVVKRGGGTCASNCGTAFRKGDEAEESGNRRRHVVCPKADPRAQEETTS